MAEGFVVEKGVARPIRDKRMGEVDLINVTCGDVVLCPADHGTEAGAVEQRLEDEGAGLGHGMWRGGQVFGQVADFVPASLGVSVDQGVGIKPESEVALVPDASCGKPMWQAVIRARGRFPCDEGLLEGVPVGAFEGVFRHCPHDGEACARAVHGGIEENHAREVPAGGSDLHRRKLEGDGARAVCGTRHPPPACARRARFSNEIFGVASGSAFL